MVANYMSLTISQITNGVGFPKAAELIEITGTHALEASDRAIFNNLLQTAHDSGRLSEPDAEWEISLAALRRPASKHESNDRIRESLRRLRRTEVKVTYISARTGKRRVMETHLLEFTDTDEDESDTATLQFGIPKRLRLVLARSNRWGRIRCEVAYAMTSKYAIALYEKLCLWANLDHCVRTLEVAEFREMLGVPPGAYERGLDFERKVIDPAVLEVNGLSDMGVQIEVQRRHARAPIHGVTLSWWKKQGDEFRAAMQERNRSKVGRMARLRGEVEKTAVVEKLAAG
jgi:plasmid replication initiation protein